MRPDHDVARVFRLQDAGLSHARIARRVGISRATVRDWLADGEAAVLARPMRRTGSHPQGVQRCPLSTDLDERAFAYVLGQYLGDGCVSKVGREWVTDSTR
jgi:hypothetical protein